MVLVSMTLSGNGLFLPSIRTPLPASKLSWNLDHWGKYQSCLSLLFGYPFRKQFCDFFLGASPVSSHGTREVRQNLCLGMQPLTPGVSRLHTPQDQGFLSSSFYLASTCSRPCLAGSSLLTLPRPLHSTQLFRSCPSPWGCF